ncbi:MAG: beta strand repeat-containing protein, partial [Candidatus Methylacidiphilales bacterium]
MAWMLVPLHLPLAALANPNGGTVVGGSASVTSSGPGQVTVTQSSNRAVVNWNAFSVEKGETTTFVQPSSRSAILNRVTGNGGVSRIDGNVNANGQVYLINRNGVVVGKTGRVSTGGGFTASTHDVANSEFMAGGDLNFSGNSSASVINHGKIRATDGDVTLIARQVENNGRITARRGTVNLAGGTEVLVKPSGSDASGQRVFIKSTSGSGAVVNNGSIRATAAELRAAGANEYALAVNNTGVIRATTVDKSGGRIVLKAEKGTGTSTVSSGNVQNSGKLIARAGSKAAPGKRGGSVVVTGENVKLTSTSLIDVSSSAPGGTGGTVNIGGGYQGKDPAIAHARTTTVEAGSLINANATAPGGKGGRIIVWSDEATSFHGGITARGAAADPGAQFPSGGGFAEVSSKGFLNFGGAVDMPGGTLLLDPDTLTLVAANVPSSLNNGGAFFYNPEPYTELEASFITGSLPLFNIVLTATNSITVNAPLTSTSTNYLTLQTTAPGGQITINAPISLNGNFTLNTPQLFLNAPITMNGAGVLSSTASLVEVGYTPTLAGRIQNAVDAVVEGGLINVAEGTFMENVRIFKGLTINGATTGTGTIVDANNAGTTVGGQFYGSVFYIVPAAAVNKNVTLNRLTIIRGIGSGQYRDGAGIYANSGTLRILNSTIAYNNTAGGAVALGGGILNEMGGSLFIQNSTIANNSSGYLGGGIYNAGILVVDSSTIAYNQSKWGGGIHSMAVALIKNSIIAYNTAGTGPDVNSSPQVTDGGNNLIGIVNGSNFSTGPLRGSAAAPVNPGIGTLGNYGGPTQTIPLLINSLAIDAGGAGMPVADQRGFVGTGMRNDIGAFEARTTGFTAPDYVVRTNADYDPVSGVPVANSLRAGLDLAEAPANITFAIPTGMVSGGVWTITAASQGFSVTRPVTIKGETQAQYLATLPGGYAWDGTPLIVVNGNATGSVFSVNPGAAKQVTLNSLNITGGTGTTVGVRRGGGIFLSSGLLEINDSVIRANSASSGTGGGIHADSGATATVSRSTISGNTATSGAGIYADTSTINLNFSTLFDNQAGYGGGIYLLTATANVTNSTLSGNQAVADGGGINAIAGSTVAVVNSTLAANRGDTGANIRTNSASTTVSLRNTIIANGQTFTGAPGVADITGDGVFIDNGFNLIQNAGSYAATFSAPGSTSILGVDPLLAPLGNYGGPTQTHALLPGSPALNTGDTSLTSATTDQRGTGFSRVVDGRADIGAFESRGFTYTVASGSGQTAMLTQAFAPLILTVSALDPGLTNLTGGKVTLVLPVGAGIASATYLPGGLTQTLSLVDGSSQATFALAANLIRGTYSASVEAAPATTFLLGNSAVSLTVTPGSGQGKNYGDAYLLPYGYTVTSVPGVDLAAVLAAYPLTGSLTREAGENAGAYRITLGSLNNVAGANPDYLIALNGTDVFFTINSIPITVTANAGQGKVYGSGPDSALTYSITSGGLVMGDSLTGSLSRAAGENAGIYAITQ